MSKWMDSIRDVDVNTGEKNHKMVATIWPPKKALSEL